jgi:2-amino-4-hydroxy-6-hydroxymethyldihydropteridine diphosphokinase
MGSNIGDRQAHLEAAVGRLGEILSDVLVSPLYETDPVGVADQPAFLNLAVSGETDLPPGALLRAVKGIEWDIGRRPTYRWGPRVVDIDILLYGDSVVTEANLTIPHPEMTHRAFVLVPLADIAPEVRLPETGETVRELRERAPDLSSVRPYQ